MGCTFHCKDLATMNAVSHLHVSIAILTHICTEVTCLALENVDEWYEYMRVLVSHFLNPIIDPSDDCRILLKVKQDMRSNPHLELLHDPGKKHLGLLLYHAYNTYGYGLFPVDYLDNHTY